MLLKEVPDDVGVNARVRGQSMNMRMPMTDEPVEFESFAMASLECVFSSQRGWKVTDNMLGVTMKEEGGRQYTTIYNRNLLDEDSHCRQMTVKATHKHYFYEVGVEKAAL